MPAEQHHHALVSNSTMDQLSHLIDQPFETWQSTLCFIILLAAIGGVAIFLTAKYMEILKDTKFDCCKAPLTLEGQRQKSGQNEWNMERFSSDGSTELIEVGTRQSDESDIRRRFRPRYVQPKMIAIGDVHEGNIAKRRASSARNVEGIRGRQRLKMRAQLHETLARLNVDQVEAPTLP